MKKLLKDSLTGKDNSTYDIGRISCMMSFCMYFVLAIASIYQGHPWSAMDFSTGCGAMAVGFGANLAIKSNTEPTRKRKENE